MYVEFMCQTNIVFRSYIRLYDNNDAPTLFSDGGILINLKGSYFIFPKTLRTLAFKPLPIFSMAS
jgi:hypothetical protein